MMNEVEQFLEKIELKLYWPTFKQNAITTLDRLFLITPDFAKELIQPIGDRIVLLKNISAQNKIIECTELGTEQFKLAENLEQILQDHIKGDAILFYSKQNGFLNAEARGILLDIVANYMLKINKKPSSYEIGLISKKICELFPSETEDTYYYLPYTNGPNQKNSAGKLIDKIRNTKSLLKKLCCISLQAKRYRF
ncbi:PREDICTED: uncharacterized protein LOC105456607 [Wasmannia auropunctata]|uniref:uncharacterized protein LOC105456607 n=1 Tax=Wasmannia auropunctata TaxID=64793 RepID=UPI0005EFC118|nr:PREDICTED: uncharacterized protein LOC105456607 [Wasmannia auropunctata]